MSEKRLGLAASLAEFYPEAKWAAVRVPLLQRRIHGGPQGQSQRFYRQAQLKIHDQESREACEEKTGDSTPNFDSWGCFMLICSS